MWRNNTPQWDPSWENKLEWSGWSKINQNKAEGLNFQVSISKWVNKCEAIQALS